MATGVPPDDSQSGILVYPRLPIPEPRRDDRPPRARSRTPGRRRWIAAAIVGLGAGGAGAWFLQPMLAPDPRIAAALRRASDAEQAASAQKQRADALEHSLDTTASTKRDLDAKLGVAEVAQAELARKAAADAERHQAAVAAQAQLAAAIDKAAGAVSLVGDEVHVVIAERALWKPGDDALTDRGKAVLARLGGALATLADRQVWVQGHADDPAPVAAVATKPAPPAKKPGKPTAAPAAPAPAARFTSGWELAAARALSVVHYLQDIAKLEPSRLAAHAFAPTTAGPKDRAAARRLEIVIAAPAAAH